MRLADQVEDRIRVGMTNRDAGSEIDASDPHRHGVGRHHRGRVVVIRDDVDPSEGRDSEKRQELSRTRSGEQQLLGLGSDASPRNAASALRVRSSSDHWRSCSRLYAA